MRYMLVAIAFAGGCYYTPKDPVDTAPSTVVEYGTIVLGKTIAFKLDECMQTNAADALPAAQDFYSQYGIELTYDQNAKLYMHCEGIKLGGELAATSYPKVGTDYVQSFMETTSPEWRVHAIVHEVGHMLGAAHVGSPNSIMYKFLSDTDHLTDDDVQMIEFHDQGEVQVVPGEE